VPISANDAKAGVIAEFVVDFDYLVPDPTTGLTYRVFRDAAAASNYFDRNATIAQPGTVSVEQESTHTDPKDGFSDITCATFFNPQVLHQATTRCAALDTTDPVTVSALRIHQLRASRDANGDLTYTTVGLDLRSDVAMAIGLVWIGILRVHAEAALLDAGASGAPTDSGYGSPPAPPSPAPEPNQLAAAQKALAACQRAAEVPNAQAVGPCMYDHGWVLKMTLDCAYGNKPNDAACYSPRAR
jgi:hypothetical protein